jgi:NADH-quinone oxidoreductase subunit M
MPLTLTRFVSTSAPPNGFAAASIARFTFCALAPASIIAAVSMVLTAGYILWSIQRVFLGAPKPEYENVPDISGREILVMAPLAVLAFALGILPWQTVFTFVHGTLDHILKLVP